MHLKYAWENEGCAVNARWEVSQLDEGGKWSVLYRNLKDDVVFDCGSQPAATPLALIMQFVLSQAEPGDIVTLHGQTVARVQEPARA